MPISEEPKWDAEKKFQNGQNELSRLREEIRRLRSTLEWYADEKNYGMDAYAENDGVKITVTKVLRRPNIMNDLGVLARDVLK